MVQEIEKLGTKAERAIFPASYFGLFHDRKVHIDEAGCTIAVAPLLIAHQSTITLSRRAQMPSVKSGFATDLKKQRTWSRRVVAQKLRRQTWNRGRRNRSAFSAWARRAERRHGHRINWAKEIVYS